MKSSARMAGLAVACAGLAMLASACGSSSPGGNGIAAKPAAQAVTTAYRAMESAASVRMYGSFTTSGQRYTIDITLAPTGMRGSMTAPFEGAKLASVDMILAKGTMYIRSSTLWRQVGGSTVASLLDNRWVILPASSLKGFPFSNAKTFINLLKGKNLSTLSKDRTAGVQATVKGQPAIKFAAKGGALYIASTGQPYPLEISQGSGNTLYFQYSGLPTSITAPSHPLDLSKLEG
jgi:hypothetical protein